MSFLFYLRLPVIYDVFLLHFSQVVDEAKYIKSLKTDRTQQIQEIESRMYENSMVESNSKKVFEDEIQSSLNSILASDDTRRAEYQLTYEEEQQNVAVCMLSFILLIASTFLLVKVLYV